MASYNMFLPLCRGWHLQGDWGTIQLQVFYMNSSKYGLGQIQSFVNAINATNFIQDQVQFKTFIDSLIKNFQKSDDRTQNYYIDMLVAFEKIGFDFKLNYLDSATQAQELYNENPAQFVTIIDEYIRHIKKKEYENSWQYAFNSAINNDPDFLLVCLILLFIVGCFGFWGVNSLFFNHNSDGIVIVNYNEISQEDTNSKAQMKYFPEWRENTSETTMDMLRTPLGGKLDIFTVKPSKGNLKYFKNERDSLPSDFVQYETKLVNQNQSTASVKIPPGIRKIVIQPE
jgi:hypothetical protein